MMFSKSLFPGTLGFLVCAAVGHAAPVDFNRDIRPILSNNCYFCHGPDEKERKADLRLDTAEGSRAKLEDHFAIIPGKPEASTLINRVSTTKATEVMPPPRTGKKLTAGEITLLRQWIQDGAKYETHWAYVPPKRAELPPVKNTAWVQTPVDRFVLAKLEQLGFKPAGEADRYALARRVALDLTGLPPTVAETDAFVKDTTPGSYERYVDKMLAKESYGEHWARLWLDLARYADSAGYADDPLRTIWAYRDYVIKSFNKNKPFDQFTIEQLAGDLLPKPTEEQTVATAFHRNTMTNNEGGTNDEEFRNVAIVDRVNTTLTTWMGTSIACAQCHSHKYDPITQKEYFGLFAILNNTEDADRGDESPLHRLITPEQQKQRDAWTAELAELDAKFKKPIPEILAGLAKWESQLPVNPAWTSLKPGAVRSKAGLPMVIRPDGSVFIEKSAATDTYTVEIPATDKAISGLKLDVLTDPKLPGNGPGLAGGNFVLTKVSASLVPNGSAPLKGRFVRVSIPGPGKILHLAEVQVFSGGANVALKGKAAQSSTDYDGPANLAIDGKTDGNFENKSVTHTKIEANPWWEVDLQSAQPIDKITLWNRTSGVEARLAGYRVTVLDEARKEVWNSGERPVPMPSLTLETNGERILPIATAFADHEQPMFPAASLVDPASKKPTGWAIGGGLGKPHSLTLLLKNPVEIPPGSTLRIQLEQNSPHPSHLIGLFKLSSTAEPRISEVVKLPADVMAAVGIPAAKRTDAQKQTITEFYLGTTAPEFAKDRERKSQLTKLIADQKPVTVPIMKELVGAARRKTKLQYRGNFQDLGEEVSEGIPAIFGELPKDAPKNRLTLAKWLVDPANPLTARVIVNRYWEQLFGLGLVRTGEEFGIQGELPTHPELLDWLATELIRLKWDMKAFVKLIVMSAAYRQDSKVLPDVLEKDSDNRWLSRGPRLRLTAEMVRDQALAASGLLSSKMYGPSVRPNQPSCGLNAAFGSSIDWKTSDGEDKYRRGLYTEWRRSNPYPSMTTFDAPNRDICTVRRPRTNTPLQALVTLNDAVYVEAAQALARKMISTGGTTPKDRLNYGFRQVLTRPATDVELNRLERLLSETQTSYNKEKAKATQMATMPLGPLPAGMDSAEAAAYTLVANVLLNLDETLMKK
ncbi:DUF1553 domain-containing protein [Zavarzinella formosa]|uniref:DUF1553 domain-containing protein n=1 Tax=Zavarzinella formosa TaxID=360055 RepID=UPI0003002CA4|nr:DUF1553 domain-containing protein [Zavarzinella formosa]